MIHGKFFRQWRNIFKGNGRIKLSVFRKVMPNRPQLAESYHAAGLNFASYWGFPQH
jgi:hypothetical protein